MTGLGADRVLPPPLRRSHGARGRGAGPGEMAPHIRAGFRALALAERSRRRLWAMLAEEGTAGVGAHFPELRAGVVTDGRWRPR